MALLADLLEDNAALHRVHASLVPRADREWPLHEAAGLARCPRRCADDICTTSCAGHCEHEDIGKLAQAAHNVHRER